MVFTLSNYTLFSVEIVILNNRNLFFMSLFLLPDNLLQHASNELLTEHRPDLDSPVEKSEFFRQKTEYKKRSDYFHIFKILK